LKPFVQHSILPLYEGRPGKKDRLREALVQVNTPAYGPQLTTGDFRLFPILKEFLSGRNLKRNYDEVKDALKEWVNGLTAEVYDDDAFKIVTGYYNCLNVGNVYIKNNLGPVIIIH
jgi:hypothetical protein